MRIAKLKEKPLLLVKKKGVGFKCKLVNRRHVFRQTKEWVLVGKGSVGNQCGFLVFKRK